MFQRGDKQMVEMSEDNYRDIWQRRKDIYEPYRRCIKVDELLKEIHMFAKDLYHDQMHPNKPKSKGLPYSMPYAAMVPPMITSGSEPPIV